MITSLNVKVVPIAEVPVDDLKHSYERQRSVILVVHDEALVADCLATVLSRAGFATMTAYDGKAALEIAFAVPPDLLISDIAIREINGIELAMAVVNAAPECKVLLCSSHDTGDDLMRACAAGYNFSSLTKPVHPAEILKQVMACLGGAEMVA
jgi:DNA-binding response OmpR family regulator